MIKCIICLIKRKSKSSKRSKKLRCVCSYYNGVIRTAVVYTAVARVNSKDQSANQRGSLANYYPILVRPEVGGWICRCTGLTPRPFNDGQNGRNASLLGSCVKVRQWRVGEFKMSL